MTRWTVKLEGALPGTEDDFNLSFIDIRDVIGPISLKRYIIQDILDTAKDNVHYTELPNIKEVSSDENDIIPYDRITLILATLKDKKIQIGILLYLSDELTYEVRGIRSNDFIDQIRKDDKKITEILTKLAKNPNLFEDVNLILPESRF
ncbi:MAG: hypothetical protein ACFFD2_18065 [Promethearchaeota archaeon]